MNKSILFVYGEGGHKAQANRLAPEIIKILESFDVVSLSDDTQSPHWSDFHYVTGEVRGKYSHLSLITNIGPFKVIRSLIKIKYKHKIEAVISTGPGVGLFAGLFFKVFGFKVIHVETWSRFTTYSMTGKFMYLVADKFYVQHKSMLKLYPKAIYSGVL